MPNQIVGLTSHGQPDGDDPVKIGNRAYTTFPTAVNDAARVNQMADKFGRQIVQPYQVRDLLSTGSATLTRVAESTILAGVSGRMIDLIHITGSNTSGVAISVNIRSGTAGAVQDTIVVPATSSVSVNYQVPLPSSEAAQAWTAQTTGQPGEISDSPVTITMEGLQNA